MTTSWRTWRRAATLAVLSVTCFVRAAVAQPAGSGVVVDLRTDKQTYHLGDPVSLDVRIVNASARRVAVPVALNVWVGNVEVVVATANGPFVRYTGPGWGLRDVINGGTRPLDRGQSWTTAAAMLYNHGMKTDHLTAAARADASDRLLESGFAFRSEGVYRVKVLVHGLGFADPIESDVVEIAIVEPKGTDRIVWNALKGDADAAYFLHTGGPKGHPRAAGSLLVAEKLQRLAAAYPSSRYAAVIQERLASFETTRVRVK